MTNLRVDAPSHQAVLEHLEHRRLAATTHADQVVDFKLIGE